MDKLITMLDSHLIYALGWTLVHSLWQSLMVVLLLVLGLKMTQTLRPAIRYRLCLTALCSCVLLSVFTFYESYMQSVLAGQDLKQVQSNISLVYDSSIWSLFYQNINPWLNWLVGIWLVGFTVQFVRYLLDVVQGVQLKTRHTRALTPQWQARLTRLLSKVQLNKAVEFKLSSRISVPCIVGHFKPVVLLPLGLLTQLPVEQIEAIVLHELAHIKRNDYLINLMQYLVKIVFFFNPFVVFICRKIDFERETACDDIAVKACGDPMAFALSLSRFAEFSQAHQTVLAANKNRFVLLNRVQRIFKRSTQLTAATERLVVLLGIAVFGLTLNVSANDKFSAIASTLNTVNPVADHAAIVSAPADETILLAATGQDEDNFISSQALNSPSPELSDEPRQQVKSSQEEAQIEQQHASKQIKLAENKTPAKETAILLASAARDYRLQQNDADYQHEDIRSATVPENSHKDAKPSHVNQSQKQENSMAKFEKPLTDLSLVAINNSGFDLALFEPHIADRQYRGIKLLPINIDKTVIDAKFKRWEPITYKGLQDSLKGINQMVEQHNARLAGIPEQDLLVGRIEIQKVVHIKLYSGMPSDIRHFLSPSVKYIVGAQLQLLVSSAISDDQMGIIWSGFGLSGESPSGKNFRFWNDETQQNYWHEVIASTLNRLDNTLVQIQNRNFVEFDPENSAQYQVQNEDPDLWYFNRFPGYKPNQW